MTMKKSSYYTTANCHKTLSPVAVSFQALKVHGLVVVSNDVDWGKKLSLNYDFTGL